MRKQIIPIFLLLGLALLIVAWRQGWLPAWNLATMRAFILGFGSWAVLIYILLMAINTITIMPPTMIMMVLSGILFGPFVGSLALWTGLLLGSMGAFLIARLIAQDFISAHLGGRAAQFNERLKENGFSVVFVARLLGLPPYELVNYASGLSKIAFRDFLLASMFGSIPGAILFATTGDRLLNPDLTDPVLYALPAFVVITFIVTRTVTWLKKRQH
ncbi:MAG: TVP38/TMEM64 family protein [Anaerolineales bacterium]|nr:TVP38/TMEM64 family protein [Anaerolineales bacterium]